MIIYHIEKWHAMLLNIVKQHQSVALSNTYEITDESIATFMGALVLHLILIGIKWFIPVLEHEYFNLKLRQVTLFDKVLSLSDLSTRAKDTL
jgi:hypothetical protein